MRRPAASWPPRGRGRRSPALWPRPWPPKLAPRGGGRTVSPRIGALHLQGLFVRVERWPSVVVGPQFFVVSGEPTLVESRAPPPGGRARPVTPQVQAYAPATE